MFFAGVIEGFYGRPWSWAARHEQVARFAGWGLDAYLYAPKSDRALRRGWREGYLADAQAADTFAELRSLADHCRASGVRFGVGLSPWGLQQQYGDDDRAALQAKVGELMQLQPDLLGIFFDDMPGAFADLAERQAAIVADIAAVSGSAQLLVCPTYYSFDPILEQLFGAMPERYLQTLGERLPGAASLMWTGAKVLAPGFTRDDIDAVVSRTGRAPVLWDNYPVNDGRRSSRFLHLRPVANRPWQLRDWCGGHLANPMNQPSLSAIALASLGASYRDGDRYDPAQFWIERLDELVGPATAALLRRDVELFQRDGLDAIAADRRQQLRAEYLAAGEPAAQEVAEWLDEGYAFDPDCLND
jgi:hypothetical protein